ncbi:MAG TPA: amidase family protein, partial [Opitutus sp.]|nr:amidase family protein [Opitutus sp.]
RSTAPLYAAPADPACRDELLAGFARSVDTYNAIVAGEAWSYHATWAERFRERYDPAVWQRLQRGATQTAAEQDRALAELASVRLLWTRIFQSVDFVLLPAAPFAALKKAECTLPNRNRLLALTTPATLGGYPVLTIPMQLPSGLTSGLQVVTRDANSPSIPWALQIAERSLGRGPLRAA